MSTEHKKDAETTVLAEKLTTGWEQFKQGKLIGYKWMALILLAVTAIGLFLYIRTGQVAETSKVWVELDGASTIPALEEFAKKNPNTTAAKVADLHVARYQLGPDGIEKLLDAKDAEQRKKAVESVEKGRDALAKLVDEFKNDPVLRAECYLGLAKAEAALIGITKDGSLTEFRGSVAKTAEWLDKLGELDEDAPWCKDARKMAAALKAPGGPLAEEVQKVQTNLYNMALSPILPPGGGPFAPPGGPAIGGIPGFPGGPGGITGGPSVGPAAPPIVTPPTGTAPIPPAVAPVTPGGQPSNPTPPPPAPVAPPEK
jgi:hypothetical protein